MRRGACNERQGVPIMFGPLRSRGPLRERARSPLWPKRTRGSREEFECVSEVLVGECHNGDERDQTSGLTPGHCVKCARYTGRPPSNRAATDRARPVVVIFSAPEWLRRDTDASSFFAPSCRRELGGLLGGPRCPRTRKFEEGWVIRDDAWAAGRADNSRVIQEFCWK